MNIIELVAQSSGIKLKQVETTVNLLEEGATVPFISRYRKEATGSLDETQVEEIRSLTIKFKEIEKRKETIIASISEQGKMTPELLTKLKSSYDLSQLEDIYLPFKPKRKTKATVAIEKGLEPLAILIFHQKQTGIAEIAKQYISSQVLTVADAINGAKDIMAEWINEDDRARASVRKIFEKGAYIYSKVKKNKEADGQKYLDYFQFSEQLSKIPSHRLLAIRRGEDENILSLSIYPEESQAINALEFIFLKGLPEPKKYVKEALDDSYNRLLKPSLETEFFNLSKEKADIEAIRVFSENLRQLLLSAPLGQKMVLAIDPGFRTGCKTVVLDKNGNLVKETVIYPHNGQNELVKAGEVIYNLCKSHHIEAIAIGNATAGRETETFIKDLRLENIQIFMISEQGASIYSASAVAREEFPNHDLTVRGAVSIGRRLMDPLAELVKIDPKSIGVGQYQHDVDQKLLKNMLDSVVISAVNKVGVNLNTASKHILSYISGLGPSIAQNIVDFRKENGDFKTRTQLKKVPRLGEKAFEQCAGFLRISNGKNVLDNSAVHPESYGIVEKMASDLHCTVKDLVEKDSLRKQIALQKYVSPEKGMHTLQDILKELEKPGLDPRQSLVAFEFDHSVRKIDDLHEGMILPGIVTNITAFGAFVDIGVKQDGLVHISQLANKFVSDPNEAVKLHQQVKVKVVEVDIARKRIALTMKGF
ncbi:MAG: Tex family protein [Bacteroidota bacterium]